MSKFKFGIIVETNMLPAVSFFMQVNGITLWPFIFIRKDLNLDPERKKILINHERIHIAQQRELFVLIFYLMYVFYWITGLIKFRNAKEAYMEIPFEKEAYKNDHDELYLLRREKQSWRKYS